MLNHNNNEFDNEFETEELFDLFGHNNEHDSLLKEANELYATMGLQMDYTEELKNKKDSRKLKVVEYVEVDEQKRNEITDKLIETYGISSMQVRKWNEQLQKIDMYKKEQRKAIARIKRKTVSLGSLCILVILSIVGVIFFSLNSTNYYINLGDYKHIYQKTIFHDPEPFIEVPARGLVKKGSQLYYISEIDYKLYKSSSRKQNPKTVSDDFMSEFKIIGKYIYYVNDSDGKTLYRMKTDNTDKSQVYDKECRKLNIDGRNLTFEESESGAAKSLDTKTLDISEERQ